MDRNVKEVSYPFLLVLFTPFMSFKNYIKANRQFHRKQQF